MPVWQPNWQDVRWNYEAANQAIAALTQAAERLDLTVSERAFRALEATAEWRGRHRDTFDDHIKDTATRASRLANEYREAARRIAQASGQAQAEQTRRQYDRERWRGERDEEERRERERQRQGRG